MTNLKFRGFHNNKPVYFTLMTIIGNTQGIPCIIVDKDVWIPIHSFENVTQFTGLIDSAGIEIYGNDIVLWQWGTSIYGNTGKYRRGIVVQDRTGRWVIFDMKEGKELPKQNSWQTGYPFDNDFRHVENEEREKETINGVYFPEA